jgi:hypothetical protein
MAEKEEEEETFNVSARRCRKSWTPKFRLFSRPPTAFRFKAFFSYKMRYGPQQVHLKRKKIFITFRLLVLKTLSTRGTFD